MGKKRRALIRELKVLSRDIEDNRRLRERAPHSMVSQLDMAHVLLCLRRQLDRAIEEYRPRRGQRG